MTRHVVLPPICAWSSCPLAFQNRHTPPAPPLLPIPPPPSPMASPTPGSWPSPITAQMLAQAGKIVRWTCACDDDVFWDETRPTEGGRTVIVSRARGDVLPAPWSAKTALHECVPPSFNVKA